MSDYTTTAEALDAIQSLVPLMVEKGIVTPSTKMERKDYGKWVLWCHGSNAKDQFGGFGCLHFTGESLEALVSEARVHIMALPSPEKAAIARFQSKIAKAVDEGRDDGIPDEYTAPVSAVVHTIHENLLEGPKAAAE